MMNAFHAEVPLRHRGIGVSVVLAEAVRRHRLSEDQYKYAGCREACFMRLDGSCSMLHVRRDE
jgi:hypothetical protein